jgi:hypothetical protein
MASSWRLSTGWLLFLFNHGIFSWVFIWLVKDGPGCQFDGRKLASIVRVS